jgi:hypothetical protein
MKIFKNTYFLVFIILTAILFGYSYTHPSYNWDLLLYTSSVISFEESNPDIVHSQTYELAQQSMPDKAYKVLVTGKYEEESYRNPEVFESLKPLAKTRPLYIFLLVILNKIGLNPVYSTALLSSLGCFFLGLICFIWLEKYFSGLHTFLLSMLIIYIGRFNPPEALSAATMLAAVFVVVEKKKFIPAFVLFAVAICLRYDNIVFPFVFLLPLFFTKREEYRISKSILGGGLAFLGIIFVLILIYAADKPLQYLSSQMFLGALSQGNTASQGNSINRFFLDLRMVPSHILIFLMPIAGYVALGKISKSPYSFNVFFWSAICTLFLRIILFPSIEIRFYIFYVTLICLLFLLELGRMTKAKTGWARK